jgi:hypothetical protein
MAAILLFFNMAAIILKGWLQVKNKGLLIIKDTNKIELYA